jgi:hypothetical protein
MEEKVSIPWKEVESQPEELGDEYFFEEFEYTFDTQRPILKKNRPYQSSFEFEDMTSPYGGGKWMCDDSLVPQVPLKSRTSRGSSPCGVSSRSHTIPTSILTWCGGYYLGAWNRHLWLIIESLRQFISLRL